MHKAEQTESAFRAALRDLLAGRKAGMRDAGRVIGAAISGGGDSMALLAMAERAGLDLHAVTVDHGLRPEAAAEADLVARFCHDTGIRHEILPLTRLAAGPNLAARARTARYDALIDWAGKQDARMILLGHTRDDQAETVLIRLARGSGADGLAAMAQARHWRGIHWLRPLLGLDRAELRDWLRINRIGWIDDPTNEDLAYDRSRIRLALDDLGALGLTRARLASTARTMARQRAVLEAAGADLARVAVRNGALGEVYLDPSPLAAALADTALRVLANALITVSGTPYRPRLGSLEALLAAVTGPGFRGTTLAGCIVAVHGTEIAVCREPAAVPPAPLLTGLQSWDERWEIGVPAPEGLWVAPLGEDGLQRTTAELRRSGLTPPTAWSTAPRVARRAVPAIYTDPVAGAADLAAVPSAGLVFHQGAAAITVRPPAADGMRHQGSE